MNATAHALLRDYYAFWNFWLTIGALVPSASLLCLVFVDDGFANRALHVTPDELRLVNAVVALFAFVCVLVQLVWKPDSREAAHAHAVHYYLGIARDSASVGPGAEPEIAAEPRTLPPLREANFIRLKQFHVRKMNLSRLLDEDPWMALPARGIAGLLSGRFEPAEHTCDCAKGVASPPAILDA